MDALVAVGSKRESTAGMLAPNEKFESVNFDHVYEKRSASDWGERAYMKPNHLKSEEEWAAATRFRSVGPMITNTEAVHIIVDKRMTTPTDGPKADTETAAATARITMPLN